MGLVARASLVALLLLAALVRADVAPGAPETVAPAPACVEDPELGEAAAALLLASVASEPPTAEAIAEALERAGSDLLGAHAIYLPSPNDARESAWLASTAARADAPLVCGRAQSVTAELVLAAPRAGRLRLGLDGLVHASLTSEFHKPVLVYETSDGSIEMQHVDPSELETGVSHELVEGSALSTVQLVAEGPAGPRPVAIVRLAPRSTAPAMATGGDATVSLAAWVRALRGLAAVPPLRPNRLLVGIAERQARTVSDTGRIAHRAQDGADPEERLRAAGLRARLVGEAIACARSEASAWDALLASPIHRAALLDRRFTDVGVGSAERSSGARCFVVLLAAWPRAI